MKTLWFSHFIRALYSPLCPIHAKSAMMHFEEINNGTFYFVCNGTWANFKFPHGVYNSNLGFTLDLDLRVFCVI